MMLQQTTVAAVAPYFARWMQRFPDVGALAKAEESEVMSYWQGLGYYARCRSLHALAKAIHAEGWPNSCAGLQDLKGIGPYTAGAVASIAWDEPVPAVDANIERLYARLNASKESGAALKKSAGEWVRDQLKGVSSAGDFNQALMDLGSTICTAGKTHCDKCPLRTHCASADLDDPTELPVKAIKAAPTELTGQIMAFVEEDRIGVMPSPGPWWKGLHILPTRIESKFEFSIPRKGQSIGRIRFAVTRYRIDCEVLACEELPSDLEYVSLARVATLALASPHRRAIQMVARRVSLAS